MFQRERVHYTRQQTHSKPARVQQYDTVTLGPNLTDDEKKKASDLIH